MKCKSLKQKALISSDKTSEPSKENENIVYPVDWLSRIDSHDCEKSIFQPVPVDGNGLLRDHMIGSTPQAFTRPQRQRHTMCRVNPWLAATSRLNSADHLRLPCGLPWFSTEMRGLKGGKVKIRLVLVP